MQRDRLIGVFEVANWLGYRIPAEPLGKDAPAAAKAASERGRNAFQKGLERGLVPPPDRKRGRTNLWFESTIRAHIEATAPAKPKRAKKARAA